MLFPLIIVGTSFLFLVIGSTRAYYRKLQTYLKTRSLRRRESTYGEIDSTSDTSSDTDSSADLPGSGSDNEFDNDNNSDHLALTRTMSRASVQESKVDRPVGEFWWVAMEEIAVMAQVGLHMAQFLSPTNSEWRFGKLPAIVGLAVWVCYINECLYIKALLTSRYRDIHWFSRRCEFHYPDPESIRSQSSGTIRLPSIYPNLFYTPSFYVPSSFMTDHQRTGLS